ncbi:MAG: hypothetical protein HC881_15745 [Leptolyngbyaceae cyanobacterium SL_7_1]|nr:hypothetical protein [Leptolyngbyaceae cyanobacterium SL_7_1]
MTSSTDIKTDVSSFVRSTPFSNWILGLLRQALLTSLLIGLLWLPGLTFGAANAAPKQPAALAGIASGLLDSPSRESDRMSAFTACLPKQLSQPNLKRALSEMNNDQLQRVFNLKVNPKLSQAESELKSCMSLKGFAS